MAIERRLTELVGPVGGKVHTGRSRNDQVALDLQLYLRSAVAGHQARLVRAHGARCSRRPRSTTDVDLPGYTHLQRAQPVLLAHHLLAYFFALQRDWERLRRLGRDAPGCRSAPGRWPASTTRSTGTWWPPNWGSRGSLPTPWTPSPPGTRPSPTWPSPPTAR